MITSKLNQLPKATVEVEINIAWDEIKESYEKIFQKVSEEIEISGFRKGKAPRELVEKHIDKNKLYSEVIRDIVPKAYEKILKDHNLTPVGTPKMELSKAKEEEDWFIKVTIALKPKINLKNYKEKIKAAKRGKQKIWTPTGSQKEEKEDKFSLTDLIEVLIQETEVELSDLLITEEANKLLANLIDQTKKLGLTVEQYLIAKGKTIEQIKTEYGEEAEKNLKIEFIINEIADRENITVGQEDIDKLIAKVEKEEEREKLKKESYYLAHLIRQQKTLDFLNSL